MPSPNLVAAEVITIAGTGTDEFSGDGGPALKAGLSQPFGLEIAPDGNLYFCDYSNHVVRRIDQTSSMISTGTIATLVGNGKAGDGPDGDPRKCQLKRPHGVFVDRAGVISIGDSGNNKIRKFVR